MRILVWFAVGFAAACALVVYLGFGWWLAIPCIVLAITALILQKRQLKIAAIVLIGIAVGLIWTWGYKQIHLRSAAQFDGKAINVTATVSDYSYETGYGIAADGEMVLQGKQFRVRLYFNDIDTLSPGDTVYAHYRLRLTTADSLKGATYHQGDGIFLLAYADKGARVNCCKDVPMCYISSVWRQEIKNLIVAAFPADTVPTAVAWLLGDSSLLDYETDTDFKVSGIRHLIAVSGLHVSILLSVVYLFSGRRRYLSALMGIPILLIFASVVGFTPSVVRACIMQALVLLALLFNKEYDPPTALAFAVVVMLGINPMTIVSVSFQLSTGCLVGIFLFYKRIYEYLNTALKVPKGKTLRGSLTRWFTGSIAISISTMITTMPLCAIYFGSISIVGILTNLITLWIVPFIFCGIILVCVVALFWMPGARLIAWAIAFAIRYVTTTAHWLAKIPFAAVYTCSIYIVIWLIMCYVLFAVFLFMKKKQPAILTIIIVAFLILAVSMSWIEPKMDNCRVSVIDVGEGQSVLFQYDGRYYLVDCGGDSEKMVADKVAQYLLSQGITHLDGIFVTHFDDDHAAAVPLLLTRISTNVLYLPDVQDNNGNREALEKSNYHIQWISRYAMLEMDGFTFTMIPGVHKTSSNERSMCILFQSENYDILITGDRSSVGEKQLLADVQLPKLDILVAGHHGSATSTSLELLAVTRPAVVAISAGKDNAYGHPAQDVLYRLELFGCSIWRTDLNGTLIFRG